MPHNKTYYLFGSTDSNIWGKGTGFDVYKSSDLAMWEGPYPVFRPDTSFWSTENFWAPEVYFHQGRYFMFATFKRDHDGIRGTAVLVSDEIDGPYIPYSSEFVTPAHWQCLDGSLYFDQFHQPWVVFCHEWVQVVDGKICASKVSDDLSRAISEPVVLFSGSEASWVSPKDVRGRVPGEAFVTDGPCLYRTDDGILFLLWSSFVEDVYAIGVAKSENGDITGRWIHHPEPLYKADGGHGMIFRTLEDRLMLAIHTPNHTPNERPKFLEVTIHDGWLRI